jgi:DNA-binding CsgD family transcriptional regulator
MNKGSDNLDTAQERAVLREWDHIQQFLSNFAFVVAHSPGHSQRNMIEDHIAQITAGCVQIWWEPYTAGSAAKDSRLVAIHYRQIRYGMLELASGYLVSNLLPNIPQSFAQLCALSLALIEREELLRHELSQLPTLFNIGATKKLTPRERDVLQGLVRGESEVEMAHRLGIEPTTVHTHLQRLYSRLDVHSPQEAILRSFELRLVDWLDLPPK